MIYPEVHTLASANLRWSGVGHKDPKRHEGLTECSSSLPTKMEDLIHYGNLRVVTEPAQSLGQSPQLNWRLPRNRHKGLTKLEESPQLNWRPQEHH